MNRKTKLRIIERLKDIEQDIFIKPLIVNGILDINEIHAKTFMHETYGDIIELLKRHGLAYGRINIEFDDWLNTKGYQLYQDNGNIHLIMDGFHLKLIGVMSNRDVHRLAYRFNNRDSVFTNERCI